MMDLTPVAWVVGDRDGRAWEVGLASAGQFDQVPLPVPSNLHQTPWISVHGAAR